MYGNRVQSLAPMRFGKGLHVLAKFSHDRRNEPLGLAMQCLHPTIVRRAERPVDGVECPPREVGGDGRWVLAWFVDVHCGFRRGADSMMHYAGIIFGTLLWSFAFGCCVLLVSGGLRQPGVGRLLAAMRNASWFVIVSVVFTEIWLVVTRIVRPDLWESEALPLPVVMLVVAAFFGVVWVALMVICNARLTFGGGRAVVSPIPHRASSGLPMERRWTERA
jgi:hypothetical protein